MRVHLRDDGLLHLPAEAVRASAIAFLRVWLGILWLFEVTVGHNWKIGGLASGANPTWVGPGAGSAVRDVATGAIADGTYAWAAWVLETLVVPNAAVVGYGIIGLQIVLGLAFIIGVAVRPLALMGMGLSLAITLVGSRFAPYFTVMHLFVLLAGAGSYYGFDGWLLRRTQWTTNRFVRAIRWALQVPAFERRQLAPGVAVTVLLSVVLLLTVPSRATERFTFVALELALLCGLVALGLFATSHFGDRLAAMTAALRVYLGIRFLWEIFTWTATGLDAMPGYASVAAQTEVFETIAAHHWSLVRLFATFVVLPDIGVWTAVFGTVQLVVGLALVVGYRTRLFGFVGLTHLSMLIGMGFTRLAPLLFGLLVAVVALDGGRILSLDSVRRPGLDARFGLPIPLAAIPFLIAIAAISALAAAFTAFRTGITPDGYISSMPSMVAAFVAIISGLMALAGWLQRHPELDHSGEMLAIGQRTEVEPF